MNQKAKKVILVVVTSVSVFLGYKFYVFTSLMHAHVNIKPGQEARIVLVNVGNSDREEITQLIDQIYALEPAVIGLDIFFGKRKDPRQDSLLMNSIKNARVVLGIKTSGSQIMGTDTFFTNACTQMGVAQLQLKEGYVFSFVPQTETIYGTIDHIAVALARFVDGKKVNDYLQGADPFDAPILISRFKDQFIYYDNQQTNFEPQDIKNKIVLLGYFGPNNEDKLFTYGRFDENFDLDIEGNAPDMYGATVIANQIVMILDH